MKHFWLQNVQKRGFFTILRWHGKPKLIKPPDAFSHFAIADKKHIISSTSLFLEKFKFFGNQRCSFNLNQPTKFYHFSYSLGTLMNLILHIFLKVITLFKTTLLGVIHSREVDHYYSIIF